MKGRARRRPSAGTPVRSTRPAGATAPSPRLIARGRTDEILALGLHRPWFRDLYHFALRVSWWRFLLMSIVLYAAANALFALIYLIPGDAIANARTGSFADAFFFSVQTIATIGYGAMSPQSLAAHLIVMAEVFVGLVGLAMITGITFSKFSRPTARVRFSRKAIITSRDGVPSF